MVAYNNEDYRVRPDVVYVFDHVDIRMVEIFPGDLVGVSVVVAAHLDEDQISRLFGVDVPCLRVVAVELTGTATRVGSLVPVPCLRGSE